MAKTALITWGGWDGHQPDKVAALFAEILRAEGAEVQVTDILECFDDATHCAPVMNCQSTSLRNASHIPP